MRIKIVNSLSMRGLNIRNFEVNKDKAIVVESHYRPIGFLEIDNPRF